MARDSLKMFLIVSLITLGSDIMAQYRGLPPHSLEDERLTGVVNAFNAEKDGRQWGRTRAELTKLLESNSSQLQNLASWWIGAQPGLTDEDRVALLLFVRKVVPQEEGVTGAALAIMRLRLKNLPRRERLETYRAAMEKGSAELWEGAKLGRREAAGLAAFDGIEELREDVDRYAVDLPTSEPVHAQALALLEFRKGAENREDAIALHLKRLEEMPNREMARRTKEDEGFASAAEALAWDINQKTSQDLTDRLAVALIPAFAACESEWSRPQGEVRPVCAGCRALGRSGLRIRARDMAWEAEIEAKHLPRSDSAPPATKKSP